MRFTKCDGPECGKTWEGHYTAGDDEHIEVEANEDEDHGQFCSWSCLAAWATQRAMDREAL